MDTRSIPIFIIPVASLSCYKDLAAPVMVELEGKHKVASLTRQAQCVRGPTCAWLWDMEGFLCFKGRYGGLQGGPMVDENRMLNQQCKDSGVAATSFASSYKIPLGGSSTRPKSPQALTGKEVTVTS